jgi:hypothetical protein
MRLNISLVGERFYFTFIKSWVCVNFALQSSLLCTYGKNNNLINFLRLTDIITEILDKHFLSLFLIRVISFPLFIVFIWLYVLYTFVLLLFLCILIYKYALFYIFFANWHSPAILTEVYPCFIFSCKANARVYLAKTGHGPHSS